MSTKVHLEKLVDMEPEDYDIYSAPFHDYRTYLFERRLNPIRVVLADKTIIMGGMRLLGNVFICMPLIKRKLPIRSDRHMVMDGLFSKDRHAALATRIRDDLEGHATIWEMVNELATGMQDTFNINYTHTAGYVRLGDIKKIADTVCNPEVQKLLDVDLDAAIRTGSMAEVDRVTHEAEKTVRAYFTDPDNAWNIFHAQLVCGSLKEKQFFQTVLHIGARTDTNEVIFNRIIRESFLTGIADVTSLAIESRSGIKATTYQKKKTADTSYLNRLLQINSIGIKTLYPGDCGSNVHRTYHIDPAYAKRYVGKLIFEPNTNNPVYLTDDNIRDYAGKTVMGRGPLTCKHTDGYCEKCGGLITKNILKGDHVGIVANVQTGPIVIQISLSAKHLIVAIATTYDIPNELLDMFSGRGNKLYFQKDFYPAVDHMVLGFQSKDIAKVNDIRLLNDDETLNPEYFSRIIYMHVGRMGPDGEVIPVSKRITMKCKSGIHPHLSPEMLDFILSHPQNIHRDGKTTWISMKGFPKQAAVLQHQIVNDSISKLVTQLNGFFKTEVQKFTSVNSATDYLAEFLWEKGFKTNILHIETLIKAFLITSPLDYYPGQVTDPDNVQFRPIGKLIPRRSIGGQLIYEQNRRYFHSGILSILPKKDGVFDAFMGYVDQCDPDNIWPLGPDDTPSA